MTQKQRNFKKALIKAVHTSAMYRGIFAHNREMYEEFLAKHYGVKSSKELSIDELICLVDYLNNKDDKLKRAVASENQIEYLFSLWINKSREKSVESLLKFCKKILKRDVREIKELSKREATKMIAVVNSMKG